MKPPRSALEGDSGSDHEARDRDSPDVARRARYTGIATADFDLDGHVDVATSNAVSSNVSVNKNGGIGNFFGRDAGLERAVGGAGSLKGLRP